MIRSRLSPLMALALLPACASLQRGGPAPQVPSQIPPEVARLSDAEVHQRLAFLVDRLEARRDYGWYWYYGWTGFYGLGLVIQSARAGVTDSEEKRADFVVSAVKAGFGVTNMLLRPLPAKDGADIVRALPGATAAERRVQLVVAEEQLRANAREAEARWSWLRHALNIAINAAGAVIIWRVYDAPSRAARSGSVGTAIGEVMILSAPWQPADDWEEYQSRFGPRSGAQVSWRIVPTLNGAAVQVDF